MNTQTIENNKPTEISTNSVSNLGAHTITKNVIGRVNQIIVQIKNAGEKNPNIKIDKEIEELLNSSMQRIEIRSYLIDKIFSPANSDTTINHKWEDMISLVVYNENNNIEFANEAYLRASGLSSMKEIISLSNQKKLYQEIYEGDDLRKTLDFVTRLESGLIPEGYSDEEFKMKRTGKKLRWNTKKNVRVGLDVTDIAGNEKLLVSLNGPIDSNLKYNYLLNKFLTEYTQMVDMIPVLSNILEKNGITKEMNANFEKLKKISLISDIIINFGPLPIFFTEKNEKFINKRFVEMSGYEYSELLSMVDSGELWNQLIGKREYEYLLKRILEIKPQENLNEIHEMKRKDGTKVNVLWNINKMNYEGSIFWSGIIISPINTDGEIIDMIDVNGDPIFYFKNANEDSKNQEPVINSEMIIER